MGLQSGVKDVDQVRSDITLRAKVGGQGLGREGLA